MSTETVAVSKTLLHAIPLRLPLIVGLTASSHFIFGNIASATLGLPTWFIDHPAELSAHQKVSGWSYFYKRGKTQYATSALITTLSFGLIAYRTPRPLPIHTFSVLATTCSTLIGVYTYFFMSSTNTRLTELYNAQGLVAAPVGGLEEVEAEGLLIKWKELNAGRMVLGAGAWIAALSAVLTQY